MKKTNLGKRSRCKICEIRLEKGSVVYRDKKQANYCAKCGKGATNEN